MGEKFYFSNSAPVMPHRLLWICAQPHLRGTRDFFCGLMTVFALYAGPTAAIGAGPMAFCADLWPALRCTPARKGNKKFPSSSPAPGSFSQHKSPFAGKGLCLNFDILYPAAAEEMGLPARTSLMVSANSSATALSSKTTQSTPASLRRARSCRKRVRAKM